MRHWRRRDALLGVLAGACASAWPCTALARHPVPVRMAFIDPLSGPASDIGRNSLRSWQFMARELGRAHGGPPILVAGFDNKASPQESVNALKAAIDQGFRYIIQGNGSGVAGALSEAISRHNMRFPDKAAILINYAAMDPALTAEKCSHWHFRIDADTSMKMRALTRFLGRQPGLERVWLLNQNYAHGQQFSLYFRQEISEQAPALQVLGDELHPAFTLEDFSDYVQRVKASGAQALVTGNWGADFRRLILSMQAHGLWIPVYGYYPSLPGTPALLATSGERLPVYQVASNHTRQEGEIGELARRFRREYGEDFVVHASYDGIAMLQHAFRHVNSTDPVQVAARLSGAIFRGFNGPVSMRADDHQLQKGVYISRWQKVEGPLELSAEGTGHAFVPVDFVPAAEMARPPHCQMQRP
ncbi:MAG: ABC transporter substrate-binding protein [Gammaproteobacteria bacterium]